MIDVADLKPQPRPASKPAKLRESRPTARDVAKAILEGGRGENTWEHEHELSRHGWEVGSTGGGDFHMEHPKHPGHMLMVSSEGNWEHRDDNDDTVNSGAASGSLRKHLRKFHKFHKRRG